MGFRLLVAWGLEIPGDLAMISFDDNSQFSILKPSVSAIAQPMQKISETIVNELMQCINEKMDGKKQDS